MCNAPVMAIRTRPILKSRWLPVAALPLFLTACDGSEPGTGPGPDDSAPASIRLSPERLFLLPDSTQTLVATVRNARGDVLATNVTWASANEAVATVATDGTVRAVSNGSTSISARAGTVSASVETRVLESPDFGPTLAGTLGEDFYLVNYVDQGPVDVVTDWACGSKSYDGHRGVDLTLRSFAQMDAGVPVLAPAPGRISEATDDQYDRNKSWTNGGGLANYVTIDHPNGLRTFYGHLRRNSITVEVGQAVAAGDTLGLVGSAGTSDHPHLHFQVMDGTEVLDPYAGSCSSPVSLWAVQEPYQDRFAFIDGGVTTVAMNLDVAKDPPPRADTVFSSAGRLSVWIHLANVSAGTRTVYRFIAPDGSEAASRTWANRNTYSMSWWWITQDIQGILSSPGTWTVEVSYDGEAEPLRRTFVLAEGVPPVSERRAGDPDHVFGGGGLRGGSSR